MPYFYLFPFFLMFYEFVLYMSNDMYIPAFPLISCYFFVPQDLVPLTLSAWLAGGALSQFILGPLSDKFGRRPVLFAGGILFLISCMGCATTTSFLFFLGHRFLQGIGVCSMMIAGYACIHETYKDQDAIHILALMSGVSVTAPMVGPLLGGYLISFHPWQSIFWTIGFFALFALIFLYFVMPKTPPSNKSALSLGLMCREYKSLLTHIPFLSACMTFGFLYSGIMLWISMSPFILMEEYALTSQEFGLIQIPIFAFFIVGTQLTRYLIEKMSLDKIITLGIAGALFSTFCLFLNQGMLGIILSMMGYALSFGITSAPLNRLSFTSSPSPKGITASLFYAAMMLTGSLITMLFGVIYNGHIASYALAMIFLSICALILFKFLRNPF